MVSGLVHDLEIVVTMVRWQELQPRVLQALRIQLARVLLRVPTFSQLDASLFDVQVYLESSGGWALRFDGIPECVEIREATKAAGCIAFQLLPRLKTSGGEMAAAEDLCCSWCLQPDVSLAAAQVLAIPLEMPSTFVWSGSWDSLPTVRYRFLLPQLEAHSSQLRL